MTREEFLYLAPYIISLFLSLGIFLYAWRRRRVRGARAYAIFVLGQTASILGFIFELISPDLENKLIWDKFQWLTQTCIIILAFLVFAIQFSEYKIRHPRIFWTFLLGPPILFLALLSTDSLHHPKVAYDLLVRIPHLKKALEIPYLHHERWDGTGYPRGLKQDEIPLAARIFAVVDVWDALSSDRPYRKAWPKEKVSNYINAESGKHFDPKVVTVFLRLLEQGKI